MLVFENPDPKIIAYWNKNLKRCIATSKGKFINKHRHAKKLDQTQRAGKLL